MIARRPVPALLLFSLLNYLSGDVVRAEDDLTVEAGDVSRRDSVVSLPWDRGQGNWSLKATDGTARPLQISGGRAWFREPDLGEHQEKRYRIVQGTEETPAPACTVESALGSLRLSRGSHPALEYVLGSGRLPRPEIPEVYRRGGYLHPVRTPSGRIVTDDYPANHLHHHGFWWAWTKTEFEGRKPDFWNMGQGSGRVDFERLAGTAGGPVFAGFTSIHRFTDLSVQPPKMAIEETWTVRLYAVGAADGFFLFDLESSQRAVGGAALGLPKYHYGGLGYRGPWGWNGRGNLQYRDSNGVTDRLAANETRVRWAWMGGEVEGRLAGVAVLGHPDNFRAPQPIRVHPDEPYHSLAPSQLGPWSIEPGTAYVSKYRMVTFDGQPDAAMLDRLWADYATPAVARLETR